jgi:hypothetical protein
MRPQNGFYSPRDAVYFFGVVPNFFLNAAMKWLGFWYPIWKATSFTE